MLRRVREVPFMLSLVGVLLLACLGGYGCGERELESSLVDGVDEFGLPEIEVWRDGAPPSPVPVAEPAIAVGNPSSNGPEGTLFTQVFAVPPTFLTLTPDGGGNPFYQAGGAAKDFLEMYGVTFPEGTSAVLGGQANQLIVRQTADQLELIEALVEALNAQSSRHLFFRLEIYDVPESVARKLQLSAESTTDHRGEWEAVLRLTGEGNADFVTSAILQTPSGQRGRAKDVSEVYAFTEFVGPKKDGNSLPQFEHREVGTILEIDPVLDADGRSITVSLLLEHHSAPPTEEIREIEWPDLEVPFEISFPVFHAKQLESQFTLASGTTRLIAAWTPTGKPEFEKSERVRLVFFSAEIHPVYQIKRLQ